MTLQVSPLSTPDPRVLRSAARGEYEAIAKAGAAAGRTLAIETFNEEERFYLVKPLSAELTVARKDSSTEDHWGTPFVWKKGDLLLHCQRFMPRSQHTTTSFVLGLPRMTSLRVPAQLCRMALDLAEKEVTATRNTGATNWHQLSREDADLIVLRCRTT